MKEMCLSLESPDPWKKNNIRETSGIQALSKSIENQIKLKWLSLAKPSKHQQYVNDTEHTFFSDKQIQFSIV